MKKKVQIVAIVFKRWKFNSTHIFVKKLLESVNNVDFKILDVIFVVYYDDRDEMMELTNKKNN